MRLFCLLVLLFSCFLLSLVAWSSSVGSCWSALFFLLSDMTCVWLSISAFYSYSSIGFWALSWTWNMFCIDTAVCCTLQQISLRIFTVAFLDFIFLPLVYLYRQWASIPKALSFSWSNSFSLICTISRGLSSNNLILCYWSMFSQTPSETRCRVASRAPLSQSVLHPTPS